MAAVPPAGRSGGRRRRYALAWMAGALLALTVGWPLAGAVAALGWTVQAQVRDMRGTDEIASDRIVTTHQGWLYWAMGDRPDDPAPFQSRDCLTSIRASWYRPNAHPSQLDLRLWDMIRLARADEDERVTRRVAVQTLVDLPRPLFGHPLLGALAGCIDGSLLSAVCDRWASQRIGDALRSHRMDLIAAYADDAARAQRIACRALDGVAPAGGPHRD